MAVQGTARMAFEKNYVGVPADKGGKSDKEQEIIFAGLRRTDQSDRTAEVWDNRSM